MEDIGSYGAGLAAYLGAEGELVYEGDRLGDRYHMVSCAQARPTIPSVGFEPATCGGARRRWFQNRGTKCRWIRFRGPCQYEQQVWRNRDGSA